MTTNKELCTSLDASKMLAETGIMAGVEADGAWCKQTITWSIDFPEEKEYTFVEAPNKFWSICEEDTVLSYRLDKTLAVLSKSAEWLFSQSHNRTSIECDLIKLHNENAFIKDELYLINLSANLIHLWVKTFLEADQNAAAKLAHLLWKEGLIEK